MWPSSIASLIREISFSSAVFVDWRGVENLPAGPDKIAGWWTPQTTRTRLWDEMLASTWGREADSITVGGITVISSRDRLESIVRAISARPSVGGKQPRRNREIAKYLNSTTVSHISFDGMELKDALEHYREFYVDVDIEADWKALAQLGVEPDTGVRIYLEDQTHDTILKLMLVSVAGPGTLTYKIDDGKIHIIKAPKVAVPPLPSPVAVLGGALKHADREVRLRAGEALGNIGPPAKPAIGALTKMLNDKDKRIQNAAAGAIKKISQTPATKPKP